MSDNTTYDDSAVVLLEDLMAWPGDYANLPAIGDGRCRVSASVRWDTQDGELDVELLDQLGQPIPEGSFRRTEEQPGVVSFDGPGHSSAIYVRVKNPSDVPIPYEAEIRAGRRQ